ncbi:circadian clock protein LdpA [Calothrix sp. PCC 6303]|nr:4Fe-4S ferredoxin iron-sulfur binding domain-containing protein [Calothrix sp. PCC 6303]
MFNPLRSLEEGHWFKLICGASFQHLPAVKSLTLAYTLAGADCIDVAADPAAIASAQEALKIAANLADAAHARGFKLYKSPPFLMVSLNDGEDPHFRKAEFNINQCPTNCHRPCEKICPAQAIVFQQKQDDFSGVTSEKCYGCGRCIPICPYGIIYARSYVSTPGAIAPLVLSAGVDAVEIHTKVGRLTEFRRLWQAILPHVEHLKLIAISCPGDDNVIEYLSSLSDLIHPLKCALVWQTDGRPMSGDIGDGTTLAAVKLGQKVLAAQLPGYVQLAGGTNDYTVAKLKSMGMLKSKESQVLSPKYEFTTKNLTPQTHNSKISGIAYGSYARVLLSSIIEKLEVTEVNQGSVKPTVSLEADPELLWQAVELAQSLTSQLKLQQTC